MVVAHFHILDLPADHFAGIMRCLWWRFDIEHDEDLHASKEPFGRSESFNELWRRWEEACSKLERFFFFAALSKAKLAQIVHSKNANKDIESLLSAWRSNQSKSEDTSVADHGGNIGLGSSKRENAGWLAFLRQTMYYWPSFSFPERIINSISLWMHQPKSKLEDRERAPDCNTHHVDTPSSALTAVSYSVKGDKLQVTARNLGLGQWESFTIPCLQDPDTNLFKEYSISGDKGLMVANDSKSLDNAHLVVFNPETGERRELPPLQYPRNPVVLHIKVDARTGDYKVIAAGSSSMVSPFSRKVEVYDSRTSKWSSAVDIPGPEFGLNEHQAGVCVGGILYFIAFLANNGSKGIVAFDIEKCEWVEEKSSAVPFAAESNILQLVECDGKLFLFSEQERDNTVIHCIDEIGFPSGLTSVVKMNKTGGRGLLVYPEFICVPFGVRKLCIFNALKRSGEVYDVGTGQKCDDDLEAPENEIAAGVNFFTWNPASFALHPNLAIKP